MKYFIVRVPRILPGEAEPSSTSVVYARQEGPAEDDTEELARNIGQQIAAHYKCSVGEIAVHEISKADYETRQMMVSKSKRVQL